MRLVSLGGYRSRDAVEVLKYLLSKAKRGEVEGIAVCGQFAGGEEEFLFTDTFRRHPQRAAYAATRMYWQAMQMQDEIEGARAVR